MKIKVYCSIGLVGDREDIIDLGRDWGITDANWKGMSEEGRYGLILDWANNYLEYGYEELDD